MPRRPASVTQADIARIIRAAKDAGLPVVRIVARPDGVAVETLAGPSFSGSEEKSAEPERVVIL